MRCAEFKFPTVCKSKIKYMNFCIDRYEYPNQLGVKPKLQNTWYQAKAQCEAQNKRLCVDNEWTQACRGPDNLPYPYGYKRDATACRIDLPWQDPSMHTFEELDKTVPAGSMPKCVSAYGAYDMTGNGDEWCQTSGGTPYQSVLKGGHPHGVRNRCTPRTDCHNEYFSFYDTGFRCCKDLK
jgi:formylglycine-generating enzyme required for sulfatase activity